MRKIRYTHAEKSDNYNSEFEVFVAERTPSWKAYGEGTARFRVGVGAKTPWLSLYIGEYAENSTKETMLDLDEPTARAFYEFLKARFEK